MFLLVQICLKFYEHEFMELACQCPAVVVCRCSPTQKADIVHLIKAHTGVCTCAIGTALPTYTARDVRSILSANFVAVL